MDESLVVWNKLIEQTGELGINSSQFKEKYRMKNSNVISVTDPEYSYAAFFEKSYLVLPEDNLPKVLLENITRTISFWMKAEKVGYTSYILSQGETFGVLLNEDSTMTIIGKESVIVNVDIKPSTWVNITIAYREETLLVYIDGKMVTESNMYMSTYGNFFIGYGETSSLEPFIGYMLDFRIYSDFLEEESIYKLFEQGPSRYTLSASTYTHLLDLEWDFSERGETMYTITESGNSSNIYTSNTAAKELTVFGLAPNTVYNFDIYTNIDPSTPFSIKAVTPSLSSLSVTNLITRVGNDLSNIPSGILSQISQYLGDSVESGEQITLSSGKVAKYVKNDETVTFTKSAKNSAVLTSFNATGGTGQKFTVVLDDSSSTEITYNESENTISHDGLDYNIGNYFPIGEYRVDIQDV